MAATNFALLAKGKNEKINSALLTRFLLVLCTCLINLHVVAQESDSLLKHPLRDTTRDLISRLRKIGETAAQRSLTKFREEQVAARQDDLFKKIKKITEAAELYVETGIDSTGIKAELQEIQKWYAIDAEGIFTNKAALQTHQNLATSSSVSRELLKRTTIRKNQVDRYRRDLIGYRNVIDSLASDSSLYNFPLDSVVFVSYIERLVMLASDVRPVDSILKRAISNIESLQTEVNQLEKLLSAGVDEIENYRQELSEKTFGREFSNLWGSAGPSRPVREIVSYSVAKGKLTLAFYSKNNSGKIFLIILIIIFFFLFLRSLKQKVKKENALRQDFAGQLILRFPLLSSILIILSLFQFTFPSPPFIFSCLIWITSSICLTVILRNYATPYWMNSWLILSFLFLLACADNLVLQASRTERWGMLFLALAGIVQGANILIRGKKAELKEKAIIYFVGFVVILELVSFFANLFGRYNLSKTFLTSGFFGLVTAILFLWTGRLINDGLALAKKVYKTPDGKSLYINFESVGEKVHPFFYVMIVTGWFVLFGRNFYIFKLIADPFKNFLFEDRTIGSYTFNISNVLIFFVIMSLSVLISKIVSFFASGKQHGSAGKGKRDGLGSWILLIRITIISMGLFLAIAATGVPVDRITIILGALSVGVGLGLQALVNNLVSGLIIAFEKPVNVGDSVEITGQSGTIKSIGFRSSIVSTSDGADVIIPNGDLLNAHLVNWTTGKNRRRGQLLVGVAFDTDLIKAQNILLELMAADERILKDPDPAVLFQQFNSSRIDVKLLFWAQHSTDMDQVKSDLISAIGIAFKEHAIKIPYPQQDLHIRTLAEENRLNPGEVGTTN